MKGLGYWTRGNPEICLLGTRGSPKRINKNVDNLVVANRGQHSAKPPEVREKIVELMGDLPRLEMFARPPVPTGWVATGLDYDGLDIREFLCSQIDEWNEPVDRGPRERHPEDYEG